MLHLSSLSSPMSAMSAMSAISTVSICHLPSPTLHLDGLNSLSSSYPSPLPSPPPICAA
eukprot:m.4353 g.4353  ORF g.4353 m.4353 type:complete len:59 (-) comp3388_c0_seq1:8-184(-)